MRPSRNNLYEAAIRRMVKESLEEKTREFERIHRNDTDAQLMEYLKECADTLGHSPHPKEIIGWELMIDRFGTWQHALRNAGLPMPSASIDPAQCALLVNEEKEQQRIYRERKAKKKQTGQCRNQQNGSSKVRKKIVQDDTILEETL